ncbi:MAG TPA: alpha/beta hydrolase [Candidatus Acidoferrales bacterium]|nr:alpha/beta hydrolase [Candidatus Acidoferrales bacterium]
MSKTAVAAAIIAAAILGTPALAQDLAIAKQGYFFVGGKYSAVGDKQVMSGQAYVEYQIPKKRTQPYPLVIVPGAAQTATNFNGTTDGREGWTQYFLRRGYAVYVVEQPGRARSSYQPDTDGAQAFPQVLNVQQRFTAPEKFTLWPQARLHTQWPGTGMAGDPNFDQFYASQVPFVQKPEVTQTLNRDAITALIDKLGPVVLMVHSQSGAYGLLATDQRPQFVKALIVVEGAGPPVHDINLTGAPTWFSDGPVSKPWGLTAIPITYAPPASNPSELTFEQQEKADAPDLARCWLQKSPARQLPNLQKVPISLVVGEASFYAPYGHCVLKFLEQAGVHATSLNLGAMGIHGNGHMMMLEKNSDQVAEVMEKWVRKALAEKSAAKPMHRASR